MYLPHQSRLLIQVHKVEGLKYNLIHVILPSLMHLLKCSDESLL